MLKHCSQKLVSHNIWEASFGKSVVTLILQRFNLRASLYIYIC